jgi:16S rRNA (guanine(966)-N(2))-methyltransferase RsmD
MLECIAPDWERVLDLYAGSGALGIEALSRGAEQGDFVEWNQGCCAIIKENLRHTGLAHKANVYCSDARKALSFLPGRYGIILLAPPYSDPSLGIVLSELASSRLVGEDTTIVAEHSRRSQLEPCYGDFRIVRELHHGDTCVSAYQFSGGEV